MHIPYRFGKISGFDILVKRNTVPASGTLWVVFSLVGHFFFELDWAPAVLLGLIAVVLHYLGELWHQIGHAAAARRAGYPMQAVLFSGLLGRSVYPPGEPDLPADVHIRRALGGPISSALLAAGAGLLLLIFRPEPRGGSLLLWFVFLDNLLVYTIGALLPLGFTDGTTLLNTRRNH